MQTVNWKIIRFTSKILADKKNNPIMLRVNFGGKRKHWSLVNYREDNLKLVANKNNWDTKKSRYIESDLRNKTLKKVERWIENYLERINVNNEIFTLQGMEQALFIQVDASSFYTLIEAHINDLKEQGKFGYARTFQDAYGAVKRFTKQKDFELSVLDENWSKRFAKFFEKEGCKPNTISIYLRNVRRIYNVAKENKLVKEDIKFKIPSNSTDKRAMSKEDMKKLISAEVPDEMHHTHNYIVFSYLAGGMNFIDIAYLQWDKNIDGNYIRYIRKKTEGKKKETKLTVKIVPPIKNILDSYQPRHNKVNLGCPDT